MYIYIYIYMRQQHRRQPNNYYFLRRQMKATATPAL